MARHPQRSVRLSGRDLDHAGQDVRADARQRGQAQHPARGTAAAAGSVRRRRRFPTGRRAPDRCDRRPEYLVTVSANGDLDKLDEALAARQIAWLAALATQLDSVPAAQLRQGDPTLGKPVGIPSGATAPSVKQECIANASVRAQPAVITAGNVVADCYGYESHAGGVVLELRTRRGQAEHVRVELHQGGHVVSHATVARLDHRRRRVVLRPRGRRGFAPGRYTLTLRAAHGAVASHPFRIA